MRVLDSWFEDHLKVSPCVGAYDQTLWEVPCLHGYTTDGEDPQLLSLIGVMHMYFRAMARWRGGKIVLSQTWQSLASCRCFETQKQQKWK
jgi:hypothetical protein